VFNRFPIPIGVAEMTTQSFDIESLLRFQPPKYLCEKCYALLTGSIYDYKTRRAVCPVCGVEYIQTKEYPVWNVAEYLEAQTSRQLGIHFNDLIGQSRKLAIIARAARNFAPTQNGKRPVSTVTPMTILFQALQTAEQFVHFTSYGISHMLLGALKMAAQRVKVRGIVSGVDGSLISELTEFENEAPNLDIKLFERQDWSEVSTPSPHQKILVIDGLLAFKGSANLTLSGWRKAAQGREIIEVATDVREVASLHNRFFSSIWAEFSNVQQIEMCDVNDLPF